jgi:putative tricarboxylic transport membrane protein
MPPELRGLTLKFNDAVSGLFFIALALAIFLLTRNYPEMPGQAYGPDLFPRLIATLMAVGGAVLLIKGWRKLSEIPLVKLEDWCRSPRHVGNFFAVLSVLVFYILVSDWLGFMITAFIGLFFLMLWLRGVAHWRSSILISLATVAVMQQFFSQFLRVPLPWGVLEAYAW